MGAPAGITQRERNQCMARHGQCYQEALALICVPDHPYDCVQLVIPWYAGSPAHFPAGAVETRSQRNIYHYHHRQYWRYYRWHFVRLLLTELGPPPRHHCCVYHRNDYDTILVCPSSWRIAGIFCVSLLLSLLRDIMAMEFASTVNPSRLGRVFCCP